MTSKISSPPSTWWRASWPRTATQYANNVGQRDYDPLFAFGFGLTYADKGTLAALPEVSGIEVTKWLKEDDVLRAIPVIAVTAFAMKGDEQKIREGGCEAYVSKPISVISFLKTIDSFLGKPK